MKKLNSVFRFIRKYLVIHLPLFIILALAIFLRSYESYNRFDFGHDGDLYSWIVKDVVVNGHFRLIGQLTSTPGIFIGPLFYYLLIPFFLISNMSPVGVLLLPPILGSIAVVSYYFVFKKLYNRIAGLIGAFLQAGLYSRVSFDRWVVPTMTITLWEIWYLYALIMLVRGNYQILWVLGLLVGLIWHINFALAPALLAVPVAMFFARKIPSIKQTVGFLIGLLIPFLPLILFELRHGFSQTKSFIFSLTFHPGGESGLNKLVDVMNKLFGNTNSLLFYSERSFFLGNSILFLVILLIGLLVVIRLKIITYPNQKSPLSFKISEYIVLLFWIVGVIGYFSISSKIVSEYYLQSVGIVVLALLILILTYLYQMSWWGKGVSTVILTALLVVSIQKTVIPNDPYNHGFEEKMQVAKLISSDAQNHSYPCVGVSFITSPGNEFGFRYVLYLNNVLLNRPANEIPVYNIIYPVTLALDAVDNFYGAYGVELPNKTYDNKKLESICTSDNINLSGSLFGFTD